jgi:hypothetical protein
VTINSIPVLVKDARLARVPIHPRSGVDPELTKRHFSRPTTKMIARRVCIHLHCNFALQLMHAGRTYIATMDIRLSLSPVPSLAEPSLAEPSLAEPSLAEPSLAETPPSMPLPPEAIYSSKEELYTSIQAWAAQHHYAFCIRRSIKIHTSPRIKITYNYDRYGLLPPENYPQKYLQARKR